nr:hypothetical protein [Tawny frogmouth aviadenovirus A]
MSQTTTTVYMKSCHQLRSSIALARADTRRRVSGVSSVAGMRGVFSAILIFLRSVLWYGTQKRLSTGFQDPPIFSRPEAPNRPTTDMFIPQFSTSHIGQPKRHDHDES